MAYYKIREAFYIIKQYPKLLSIRRKVSVCGTNLRVYGTPIIVSPENIHIGNHVTLNTHCILNASNSKLDIGNNVTISAGAKILSGTYDTSAFIKENKRVHVEKSTVIGDNVWVCTGAIICPGVHIRGGQLLEQVQL